MRYRAFLSYSHADEAAAAKLHRALERYTLPRRVRKAHALPRRLIPIFRDVDELAAASGLNTRLQDALDQSQWLIVLCSPAAAQSKYVNQEIEYFLQKHGPNRILCALAAGEPAECFPPALRALNEEPLAADFRPGKDFELSKLKLIAALAGVGFTELRSREAQRRKRQQLIAAALLAGVGLGGLAYWDLFHREHVDYYASYVRRYGIWEGVDRISAETASHRSESYRFTRSGRLNPPERVDHANGHGICTESGLKNILGEIPIYADAWTARRYCSVSFEYSRRGVVNRETLHNRLGAPVDSLTYTNPELAQFTLSGFATPSAGSGVNYVKFERDENGFDKTIWFLHAKGSPRPNQQQEYGFAFSYDAAGRVTRKSVLDGKGKEAGEVTRMLYSPQGHLIELRHEDFSGAPRLGREGYAVLKNEFNSFGDIVRSSYHAADGRFTKNNDGYAIEEISRDPQGNSIEFRTLDEAAQPMPGRAGRTGERYTRDSFGQRIRTEYLGLDPKFSDAVVITEHPFDDKGNITEFRTLDAQGRLVNNWSGAAIDRRIHDARGDPVDRYYFDSDGNPAKTPWGAHIRLRWDERGNSLELDYEDGSGRPHIQQYCGCAGLRYLRDERGNITETLLLGADGKPIVAKYGWAFEQAAFDDLGNQIERRLLDTRRRLVRGIENVAIFRARFDALGRLIEETYFDELQRPVLHKEGYFGYRATYDDRGRLVGRMFLDGAGGPMKVASIGHFGSKYHRDVLGNVLEEVYLDAAGLPVKEGMAKIEYRLNAFGQRIEWRYYDGKGVPTMHPSNGCHFYRMEYNATARPTAERCLNLEEKPVSQHDKDWAFKTIDYSKGHPGEEHFFNAAGREVKPLKP